VFVSFVSLGVLIIEREAHIVSRLAFRFTSRYLLCNYLASLEAKYSCYSYGLSVIGRASLSPI